MVDSIQFPTGYGPQDIVSWGTTGMICLDQEEKTVVKSAHDDDKKDKIAIEKCIYERFQNFGGHSGILNYYGSYESGIRLEYAPNWDLSKFIRDHPDVSVSQRLHWAEQIADALYFIHTLDVIHGDLTLTNIFLTQDLDAKLADFAGSSLDGSTLLVIVTQSHRYPGPLQSTDADIFALGSVLYAIMTGRNPYQGRSENEIRVLYEKNNFPETDSLGAIGAIITKCWQVNYNSAADVHKEIKGICQNKPAKRTYFHRLPMLSISVGILAAMIGWKPAWRLFRRLWPMITSRDAFGTRSWLRS